MQLTGKPTYTFKLIRPYFPHAANRTGPHDGAIGDFSNLREELLLELESPADTEHMAIGMAKVHLADVPRHIGGRKGDLQPGGDAVLVPNPSYPIHIYGA